MLIQRRPGIAYYLSRFYRRSELAFRLSLYIVMAPLAGAFGGLLASAILTLDSFGSLTRWRMIFAIEGIITCLLSLIAFFTLTDRPETARWLTQEEKDLAIARVKSERVGQSEVLDKLDKKKLLHGIFNPVILTTAFIFLLDNITVQGLAFFAPTIVRTIYPKNTVVSQQLHTVPPYIVGAFFTVLIPFISWRIDRRTILFICSAPLMMIGYVMVSHLVQTTPPPNAKIMNSSLQATIHKFVTERLFSLHRVPSPLVHYAMRTHPPTSSLTPHELLPSARSSCLATSAA
jgi:MFS family permease